MKNFRKQTNSILVIKDWYQEEALLNYWADEIGKILKEEVKQDSFKGHLFSP